MPGRLLLLDTASLYYRAFFGLPDTLKAPDGTVVNAVRGLVDFVATLVNREGAEAVVACWDDDWRPAWRVELVPTYKTQRLADGSSDAEQTPDDLSPQVPLIAEALTLLGIPVVGAPDAEADDVIGTLVDRWDGPVDVVTGDRDLFQLVDDAAAHRVLYTARGVSKLDEVDEAWIREKYDIDAARYVDYAVLRGDASDGLPGVAGIGEKTAAALLGAFGDLDGILAAAQDPSTAITPRPRRSLVEQADYVAAARQVVAVRRDLDLPEVAPLPRLTSGQVEEFREFATTWGLGGAADRVLTALQAESEL
ncbi:5'-3' exonuclease, SAM domain protein [Aeromicrobium marinum DSM 15272]|uniref:5'-3' exonuclease n=1 Tax=Aeromicrobium marinum DSM 15272 TaxID=585531 RepID=E2S9U9_9ACTN|nr:5'-3' exonuclease [Aeromicrobium marinum]EFQ84023.1 5'-3' exonuclease, SAM domain protein [Aeromicrobium marinum DSM 15272]